jgi:hypothetical protein
MPDYQLLVFNQRGQPSAAFEFRADCDREAVQLSERAAAGETAVLRRGADMLLRLQAEAAGEAVERSFAPARPSASRLTRP